MFQYRINKSISRPKCLGLAVDDTFEMKIKRERLVDFATLVGILGAFGVVLGAMILGGSPLVFINVPSLLIVFGGSLFVVLMKFGIGQFIGAFKVVIKAFIFKSNKPSELIAKSVELAGLARKNGLLALESVEIENPYMKKGIQFLVDGLDATVVKSTLQKEKNLAAERHEIGISFFKALGDVGPAMGMIGTLIGLVQMLSAMDDPKSIGPAMAVALLTTLYGAMLATMIALPIADKLALRNEEEQLSQALIIDAIMSIQQGLNPRVIEELLTTYLPGSNRNSSEGEEGEAPA